jgi:hypothetical protein
VAEGEIEVTRRILPFRRRKTEAAKNVVIVISLAVFVFQIVQWWFR